MRMPGGIMTEKLYFEDSYVKEFTAEILNVIEKSDEFHIELDKTAFFPGGIAPFDVGEIAGSKISSVYEKDGIIYHVSNKKPIKIHKAKCSINWENRFHEMQKYLSYFILYSILSENFGCNILNFKIGNDSSLLEINKSLKNEEIEQLEIKINQIIFDRKEVVLIFPTKSQLKKSSFKKIKEINDNNLRIVSIEDMENSLCYGLLPKSTLEVQFIKIIKAENIKGNMNLEFLCGRNAIEDSLKKYKFSQNICKYMNSSEEDLLIKISNISSSYNNLLAENKILKSRIADFEVENIINTSEKIGEFKIVKNIFIKEDMNYITLLSSKLTNYEDIIVLYGLKTDDMAYLLFNCSKNIKILNMNELLKDAISLIDGRGGGRDFSAKGAGKGINNLESAMEYALNKVKNTLKT